MCPGANSASKSEYQDIPGVKGGRYVRLTTYHLHVPIVKKAGALISWNPVGLFWPVLGQLLTSKIVSVSTCVSSFLHFILTV